MSTLESLLNNLSLALYDYEGLARSTVILHG
jgi:hypothetical protein